jgi:hypothetical protein
MGSCYSCRSGLRAKLLRLFWVHERSEIKNQVVLAATYLRPATVDFFVQLQLSRLTSYPLPVTYGFYWGVPLPDPGSGPFALPRRVSQPVCAVLDTFPSLLAATRKMNKYRQSLCIVVFPVACPIGSVERIQKSLTLEQWQSILFFVSCGLPKEWMRHL